MTMHPRESRYGRREFLGALRRRRRRPLEPEHAPRGLRRRRQRELQAARPDARETGEPGHVAALRRQPDDRVRSRAREGTLRIYNWNGYLWPKIKKDFAKEYGVEVEETFFSTTDEAVAKISSGAVDFDVFFPTQDRIGRLVLGKSLQPLNHDYLPNLANVWPSLQDPWYDKGSQYTVPVHDLDDRDRLPHRQGRDDTGRALEPVRDLLGRGEPRKAYLLDDGRDAPAHMLLKNGIHDTSTPRIPTQIELAKNELKSLYDAVNVKLSTDDYTNLPEGRAWVHQMWSGSAISAQWYLPEGTGPEALGYWFPPDGRGRDRQRHDRDPAHREEPRPRAPLPQLPARREERVRQLRRTTSATSRRSRRSTPIDSSRTASSPKNLTTAIVRESDFERHTSRSS